MCLATIQLSVSPPQRLSPGIPIKIAIIEKWQEIAPQDSGVVRLHVKVGYFFYPPPPQAGYLT